MWVRGRRQGSPPFPLFFFGTQRAGWRSVTVYTQGKQRSLTPPTPTAPPRPVCSGRPPGAMARLVRRGPAGAGPGGGVREQGCKGPACAPLAHLPWRAARTVWVAPAGTPLPGRAAHNLVWQRGRASPPRRCVPPRPARASVDDTRLAWEPTWSPTRHQNTIGCAPASSVCGGPPGKAGRPQAVLSTALRISEEGEPHGETVASRGTSWKAASRANCFCKQE